MATRSYTRSSRRKPGPSSDSALDPGLRRDERENNSPSQYAYREELIRLFKLIFALATRPIFAAWIVLMLAIDGSVISNVVPMNLQMLTLGLLAVVLVAICLRAIFRLASVTRGRSLWPGL